MGMASTQRREFAAVYTLVSELDSELGHLRNLKGVGS